MATESPGPYKASGPTASAPAQRYSNNFGSGGYDYKPGEPQWRWFCPLCKAKGYTYSMARLNENILYVAIGMHMAMRHADVAPVDKFIPRADPRCLWTADDTKFLLECGIEP